MTDKVQKIREKVVEMVNSINPFIPDEDGKNSDYEAGKLDVASKILQVIDSLQEEPVSIWHDASEEPNGDNSIVIAYDNGCTVEPSFKDFKSYSEWGTIKKSYKVKQWAYIDDLLNPSNVQRTIKNWEEEPVSEDLEKEIEKLLDYSNLLAPIREVEFIACYFTKWQKDKMIKDAIEVTVHIEAGNYPYIPQMELYDYDKDVPLAKEGEKYKVILIKEE